MYFIDSLENNITLYREKKEKRSRKTIKRETIHKEQKKEKWYHNGRATERKRGNYR